VARNHAVLYIKIEGAIGTKSVKPRARTRDLAGERIEDRGMLPSTTSSHTIFSRKRTL
jgi:hypothetical protein